MAMAQVFIPNPHDSIPALHLPTHTSPSFPSSPPLPSIPSLPEDDSISFPPPAPPPSPEMQQRRFGPLFHIDPKKFETPRKSELPPSPTLEFSALFNTTPNRSPFESEPHSPTQPSPGDNPDSAYTSSRQSNAGSSSQSIPISPTSAASSCYSSLLSHSHSEGDEFHGLRPQTALAQHPNNYLSTESASPVPRPRSHTHPSHSLTPHATYTREQRQRQEVCAAHPHLPHSFEAAQLQTHTSSDGPILDSGYHESDSPFPRKKSNLKRKVNELGYDHDPTDIFSYDSYSTSACSSESEWLVIHPKGNKKACQEGENPIIRRQSASFSGVLTTARGNSFTPFSDGTSNFSAPPTPNHPSTSLSRDFCFQRNPSLSPPVFSRSSLSPCPPTPTITSEVPTSLQSMEVADEGTMDVGGRLDSLDSMDCSMGEHCVEMDSLTNTLRSSHLEHAFHCRGLDSNTPLPQIVTLSAPQPSVPPCRSYSSGDGYDFSQEPQLAQDSICFSSYHEAGDGGFISIANAESRFLLSKSL